jgi:hypothetical protein
MDQSSLGTEEILDAGESPDPHWPWSTTEEFDRRLAETRDEPALEH